MGTFILGATKCLLDIYKFYSLFINPEKCLLDMKGGMKDGKTQV